MEPTGVVILAHGSRGDRGEAEVANALERVACEVGMLLAPGVAVVGAALQFNRPDLGEAVEALAERGVRRILIMPYFLFSGRHITEHIPELVEKMKGKYPDRRFVLADPLGLDECFIGQVVQRIGRAIPELLAHAGIPPRDSSMAIEQQSMKIVEELLASLPAVSAEERAVVGRIVHATGDPDVAGLALFSRSAVPSGLAAIAAGRPIYTDVRMVAAGINRQLAMRCGCSIVCALDEAEKPGRTQGRQVTRTAAAVHSLGTGVDGAIVAIGNAPTALLALVELVDGGVASPALVVGMPVGFVQAKESKEELMKRNAPYITVRGTRGGSAMAAATVNALLRIAVERNGHGESG